LLRGGVFKAGKACPDTQGTISPPEICDPKGGWEPKERGLAKEEAQCSKTSEPNFARGTSCKNIRGEMRGAEKTGHLSSGFGKELW